MKNADPIAALDQAASEMVPIAKLLRAHYTALREQGFPEAPALRLTEVLAAAWWCAQLGTSDAAAHDD
jgi:hypothetical protein